MNIFILDDDITRSVDYYCDEHVKKMVVESAQMLSTAQRVFALHRGRGERAKVINRKGRTVNQIILPEYNETSGMKMTDSVAPFYWVSNENHPCNQWIRENSANYEYLYHVYVALTHQYIRRYSKVNAASNIAYDLEDPPLGIQIDSKRTSFVQALPDAYKQDNAVDAYRAFYVYDKSKFASWERGVPAPDWFVEGLNK